MDWSPHLPCVPYSPQIPLCLLLLFQTFLMYFSTVSETDFPFVSMSFICSCSVVIEHSHKPADIYYLFYSICLWLHFNPYASLKKYLSSHLWTKMSTHKTTIKSSYVNILSSLKQLIYKTQIKDKKLMHDAFIVIYQSTFKGFFFKSETDKLDST